MSNELFNLPESKPAWQPLALRLAPKTLKDYAGQKHLLGPGGPLAHIETQAEPFNAIFFGPPGCGKTALAYILAQTQGLRAIDLSCVIHGVPKIREVVAQAEMHRAQSGKPTMLILDEIHHLNRTQQDFLLPYMERGLIALVGLTTENPFFYIHKAIISRALVFEFKNLSDEDLRILLERAVKVLQREKQPLALTPQAQKHLVAFASGDGRRLLNGVEFLSQRSKTLNGKTLDAGELQKLLGLRQISYDKGEDSHYDLSSAFIKSMRGSDPDASIYWMTKMLEGGEDPRFIARRIVIAASEDVGNADSMALILAQNAFAAVEMIGLPEAALILSHAAIYVACAPKSNACCTALQRARQEITGGRLRPVPDHLKDSNLDAALGHGQGYEYAHDYPGHFVKQIYLPDLKVFYSPSDEGMESKLKARLKALWPERYAKIDLTE